MSKPTDAECAWAAGFFDGEGCTTVAHHRGRSGQVKRQLRMIVKQVDPRPLARFYRVVGVGGLYGPYPRVNPNAQPAFEWSVGNRKDAAYVYSLIGPFLSDPKREQYARAVARASG